MLTDIGIGNMRTVLYQIWANLYVEYVVKSPLSPVEHTGGCGVANELFEGGLDAFIVRSALHHPLLQTIHCVLTTSVELNLPSDRPVRSRALCISAGTLHRFVRGQCGCAHLVIENVLRRRITHEQVASPTTMTRTSSRRVTTARSQPRRR